MTDTTLADLREESKKHRASIVELQHKLNQLERRETPPSGLLRSVLESKLLATLLTVIVGVLGGRYLAEHIQANAQDLQDLQKVYDDAFSAVARATTASQSLLNLIAEHSYIVPADPNAEKNAWGSYRTAMNEWLSQRQRLGLMLATRSVDSKEVTDEWDKLCKSVDSFDDCAFKHNQSYAAKPGYVSRIEVRGFCASEKSDLSNNLVELSQLLHRKLVK